MKRGVIKKGFTLLELTISMLFVTLLSISIAVVVNNVISSYQRGSILSKLNSTGNSLVDDMRSAVQDSLNRTKLGENVSIIKTTRSMTIGGTVQSNIPIYGIFCSGSYTYFWNSGYYFSGDASFQEKQEGKWAQIQLTNNLSSGSTYYNPNSVSNKPPFRLVKVQDTERAICISTLKKYGNNGKIDNGKLENTFDVSELNKGESSDIPEIITLLQNDNDNDLALYDLLVEIPATNLTESLSLYNISFILGTTTGGVDIATSGNSCAAPVGDINWSNSCAVSRFNFVTESNAADIGIVEQIFLGEVPEAPEVTPPPTYYVTYKNTTCPNNPAATKVLKNDGTVAANTFQCNESDFLGWNTSELGTGTSYQPGDSIPDEQNMTLYAIWKVKVYYTVTYYVNVAGYNYTQTSNKIEEGQTYTVIDAIWQRSGYLFNGWNTNADGTGTTYNQGDSIIMDSNKNLYSQWKLDKGDLNESDLTIPFDSKLLNALTLFPYGVQISPPKKNGVFETYTENGNTYYYYGIGITGTAEDGTDTSILRISQSLGYNPRSSICEQFNAAKDCDKNNAYTATVYELMYSNTTPQPAVIYLEFANPKKAISGGYSKNDYSFYASSAWSPYDSQYYDSNGTPKIPTYNDNGCIGTPIGIQIYPFAFYFKCRRDDLVALNYLPTRIYGKNAIVEDNQPKYWIIAKLYYYNNSLTVTPINKFTNTAPTNFINN